MKEDSAPCGIPGRPDPAELVFDISVSDETGIPPVLRKSIPIWPRISPVSVMGYALSWPRGNEDARKKTDFPGVSASRTVATYMFCFRNELSARMAAGDRRLCKKRRVFQCFERKMAAHRE